MTSSRNNRKRNMKTRGGGYLTNEEERRLALAYLNSIQKDGVHSEEAKGILLQLIQNVQDYIYREANKYHAAYTRSFSQSDGGSVIQFEDAVMEGVIGFIVAAMEYKPEHESSSTLLTYARQSIKASIMTALQGSYGAPRYAFDQSGVYKDSAAYHEWREILKKGGAIPFSFLSYSHDPQEDADSDYWDSEGIPIFESQEFSFSDLNLAIDLDIFRKLVQQFILGFPDLRRVKKVFREAAKEAREAILKRDAWQIELEIFSMKFGLLGEQRTLKDMAELTGRSSAKIREIVLFYQNVLKDVLEKSGFVYD